MKNVIFILLLFLSFFLNAQNVGLNCNRLGHLPYNERLSSVWGYTDFNAKEYALVGAYSGVSIVDISNPTAPQETVFIPGRQTIWRELKTWNDYMFVVSEQVSEGILIADLTHISSSGINYNYKFLTVGTDTLRNAHALYIDELGYLYLAGANLANGAPLIFNLNPDPRNPVYVGTAGTVYAHDVFVRSDTLWAANIGAGYFSVYDISNRAAPQLLNAQSTGFSFTHNVWLSDNSNFLFSTDERAGAFVESYDVSDLTDIRLLDKWRTPTDYLPVPHNVHVLNDYLVVSYYTEGVVILDAKVPNNLVQIGQYDTYPPFGNGFLGCWGVYPYFPSGLIAASDINTGLHILQPDYKRACRLQGRVNTIDGFPLFNVQVEIVGSSSMDNSILDGTYKTGIHSAGNYQVRFRKEGFLPEVRNLRLFQDSTVTLNITMTTAMFNDISGNVLENNQNFIGIPNAQVKFLHSANFYEKDTVCDVSGSYRLSIQEEEYRVIAGKWGYKTADTLMYVNAMANPIIKLDSAIYDDFVFDFNWSVSGNIVNGAWERVIPNTGYQWVGMMPVNDVENDIGSYCYLSGVADSRSDSGISVLTSPVFNALNYDDPHVSFYYWLTCFDSTYSTINDSLKVVLNNGSDTIEIASYKNALYNWSGLKLYRLADYLPLTNTMSVSFIINNSNSRNYTEAAIDRFRVDEYEVLTSINTEPLTDIPDLILNASPNPFSNNFVLNFSFNNQQNSKSYLHVFDISGKLIEKHEIVGTSGQLVLGNYWNSGIYFLELNGKNLKVLKKQ